MHRSFSLGDIGVGARTSRSISVLAGYRCVVHMVEGGATYLIDLGVTEHNSEHAAIIFLRYNGTH